MVIYTVQTRQGKVFHVDSELTDSEAQKVLQDKESPSSFERDLSKCKKHRLTPRMAAWLHVLAQWALNPREEPAAGKSFPRIRHLLTHAREAGKKYPKIRLEANGQSIVLSLSRTDKVNVTDGKPYGESQWFGAIQPNDGWRQGVENQIVMEVLEQLEKEPERVASQHGVATGNCCFCSRDLTTKESRSVGYGPICANKFGLPWGEIDPNLESRGILSA